MPESLTRDEAMILETYSDLSPNEVSAADNLVETCDGLAARGLLKRRLQPMLNGFGGARTVTVKKFYRITKAGKAARKAVPHAPK